MQTGPDSTKVSEGEAVAEPLVRGREYRPSAPGGRLKQRGVSHRMGRFATPRGQRACACRPQASQLLPLAPGQGPYGSHPGGVGICDPAVVLFAFRGEIFLPLDKETHHEATTAAAEDRHVARYQLHGKLSVAWQTGVVARSVRAAEEDSPRRGVAAIPCHQRSSSVRPAKSEI
jgi:hypothetical protein